MIFFLWWQEVQGCEKTSAQNSETGGGEVIYGQTNGNHFAKCLMLKVVVHTRKNERSPTLIGGRKSSSHIE